MPILAHTIKQINDSQLFSRIIVSTEDLEISRIAKESGAEVIKRDLVLADDNATTIDVVSDSIVKLGDSVDSNGDLVCCIYPITPKVYPEYILEAVQLLITENLDFVFSAKQFESAPTRALEIDKDGFPKMIFSENLNRRTQDLPTWYHDAALFYLGRAVAWMEKRPILTGHSKFIEIGKYQNIDVDDEEDWDMMVKLFKTEGIE